MGQDTLYIDSAVDVVIQDNGIVRFLTPHGDLPIADPFGLVAKVASQCREGATPQGLAEVCPGEGERDAVSALTQALADRRILTRYEACPSPDILTDWVRYYGGSPAKALPAISIAGTGRAAEALRMKLGLGGFKVVDTPSGADCLVAVSDNADLDWLREMNAEAFAERRPFLPVWLDRSCVNWGPMVLPGATGCLECRWHREQASLRSPHPSRHNNALVLSASGALADLAAVMAQGELLRWALDGHVETELGMAWRFDFLKSDLNGSRVNRLPRCPTCGMHG